MTKNILRGFTCLGNQIGSIGTVREIRSASWPHWKEAISYTLYNIIGGLLPLWGTLLVFELFSKAVEIHEFLAHGEFALYSAAFIAPVIYVIVRDSKNAFVNRGFFILVTFVLLLVSAIVFGSITAMQNLADLKKPFVINENFLADISWVLLALSMLVSLIVTLLDNIRTNVDLKGITEKAELKLSHDFDLLKDQK